MVPPLVVVCCYPVAVLVASCIAGFVCILLPAGAKLMFASVQPSAATLVCVATDSSNLASNIMWLPSAAVCCYPVAVPCENFARRSRLVFCRPLPLVQVAPSATGGAPFTPQIFTGFASSKGISSKKSAIPDGMTDFLELLARFELATSSLPRMRSTG